MVKIATKQDFADFIKEVEAESEYHRPLAFGVGIAHMSSAGNTLDTLFTCPNFKNNFGTAAILAHVVGHKSGTASYDLTADNIKTILDHFKPFEDDGQEHANIETLKRLSDLMPSFSSSGAAKKKLVVSFIAGPEHDDGPKTVSDAYLRLHLLSHRLVKPNCINLESIFGVLPKNVWTNEGPISPEDLEKRRLKAFMDGDFLQTKGVDKFPQMTDYVVPSGVRIADSARVRLGAYLGEGTTVMHEGFVNFNAGSLGASMIEGRISAGVVIGDQTDVGGGASTMGTLSGGGEEKITIGRGCLLGANSGIGISLGDKCVIEAGLYVTAGMMVLYRKKWVKARELSGKYGLTFIQNSKNGQVQALDRPNKVELNEELHSN